MSDPIEELTRAMEVAVARLQPSDLEVLAAAFGLPAGSLTVNGLQLTNPDTTFEEWAGYGHRIAAFSRWSRFALGDWLLFGESIFGEEAAQAIESTAEERYDVASRTTGLQIETLKNYVRVCQLVPLPIRRVELGFSMHEVVASKERQDQIYWLNQAVEQGYDREALRQAIRDAERPPSDPGASVVVDPPLPPLTKTEQLEQAAHRVFHQAQPVDGGGVHVPAEPWAALCSALGEE